MRQLEVGHSETVPASWEAHPEPPDVSSHVKQMSNHYHAAVWQLY